MGDSESVPTPTGIVAEVTLKCRFSSPTILLCDGKSEIGGHGWSDLGCMICARHLFNSREVTKRFFFSLKRPISLHIHATCSELPSNISTMSSPGGACTIL